jgi:DNA-binding transcriptional MerR regulator
MERPLTIGQLAVAAHISAKTIRYYERVGVLPMCDRNAAGYRQYTRRDIHRLQFLCRARALGLSLADLKALTAALEPEQGAALRPRLKALVAGQLRAVQQRIGELQILEHELAQVLNRLQKATAIPNANGCRCLDEAGAG